VAQQHVLDLRRIGVEAADDVHVLHPAHDLQVTGLGELADVAGLQPAVGRERLGRGIGVVEVLPHHAAAPQDDLARAAPGHVVSVAVDEPKLERGPEPADCRGDRLGVVVGRGARGRARLGEPVSRDQHLVRQLVEDAPDQLDRDVRGPDRPSTQAGQVVAVAVGVVEEGLEERGGSG
jgi:hypothetical protein